MLRGRCGSRRSGAGVAGSAFLSPLLGLRSDGKGDESLQSFGGYTEGPAASRFWTPRLAVESPHSFVSGVCFSFKDESGKGARAVHPSVLALRRREGTGAPGRGAGPALCPSPLRAEGRAVGPASLVGRAPAGPNRPRRGVARALDGISAFSVAVPNFPIQ